MFFFKTLSYQEYSSNNWPSPWFLRVFTITMAQPQAGSVQPLWVIQALFPRMSRLLSISGFFWRMWFGLKKTSLPVSRQTLPEKVALYIYICLRCMYHNTFKIFQTFERWGFFCLLTYAQLQIKYNFLSFMLFLTNSQTSTNLLVNNSVRLSAASDK